MTRRATQAEAARLSKGAVGRLLSAGAVYVHDEDYRDMLELDAAGEAVVLLRGPSRMRHLGDNMLRQRLWEDELWDIPGCGWGADPEEALASLAATLAQDSSALRRLADKMEGASAAIAATVDAMQAARQVSPQAPPDVTTP